MKTQLFLLLGTNLGEKATNLKQAKAALAQRVGVVVNSSGIYRTAAWGKTDQPDFYNQVVELETELTPEEVLHTILTIEHDMGRERMERWGTRLIDIDLLLYGDVVMQTETLTVPHAHLANRRFTLVPLAEIAGNTVHPKLKMTIHELLERCGDELQVTQVEARIKK